MTTTTITDDIKADMAHAVELARINAKIADAMNALCAMAREPDADPEAVPGVRAAGWWQPVRPASEASAAAEGRPASYAAVGV